MQENYTAEKAEIDFATQNVYLFQKEYPYVDLMDVAYFLQQSKMSEAARGKAAEIRASLENAINDARVMAITGIIRTTADGVFVCPAWGDPLAYSIGISIYSKTKDKAYQKYGNDYTSSAFDAATGWSKWFDANTVSVMDKNAPNPCNDSAWELYWMGFDDEE